MQPFWYLFSDLRLGVKASALIEQAIADGDHIGVSAISLAEIVYLIEKNKIRDNTLELVLSALVGPEEVLQIVPLDEPIAVFMQAIPRRDDLPDRVIAATGLFLGIPVLSRDGRIRTSVVAVW